MQKKCFVDCCSWFSTLILPALGVQLHKEMSPTKQKLGDSEVVTYLKPYNHPFST